MNQWIIISIYWIVVVAAVYAYRVYKNKKNRHLNAILKAFGATKEIPVWKKIVSHVVTVLLVPPLAPIGLLVFLIDRIKKQVEKKRKEKQEKELQKLLTRIDLAPPIDMYCNASVALMNAVAYGRFNVFEKMLNDDVQIIQDGQETITGKEAALRFWRSWKTDHVDTIDFDAFERIFVDVDFEVIKSDDDTHACVRLMMTQQTVKFDINEGRVVKIILFPLDYPDYVTSMSG
jgi:hypothetical protein